VSRTFFEQVVDVVVGLIPSGLGSPSTRYSAVNMKLWFGDADREHYEAQFLRDGTVEIGFHAEHRSAEANEAVLETLVASEAQWRGVLGPAATAGRFVGTDRGPWRRLSEVGRAGLGADQDLDAAVEVAERLADYVEALEPIRRGSPADGTAATRGNT